MSAAVSLPDEPAEDAAAASLAAQDRASLVEVATRTKARWAAEIAAGAPELEGPQATRSSPPALAVPATAESDFFTVLQAQIEADRLRVEEHKKTCTADICESCERHACGKCAAVRVERYAAECTSCRLQGAIDCMRIPREYADAYGNLATRVRNPDAGKIAKQSLDAPKIVLVGPAGSGKSTLATAMLVARQRSRIRAGRRIEQSRFYSAIELGRARSKHRLGDGDPEEIRDAMEVPLLVLDDVGAEPPRESEVITEIIHARHDAALHLWVTTGLSPDDIGARYGGGIERRLFERAVILDCLGGPKR